MMTWPILCISSELQMQCYVDCGRSVCPLPNPLLRVLRLEGDLPSCPRNSLVKLPLCLLSACLGASCLVAELCPSTWPY